MSAGEDLARAFTLPASAYIDESVYARERDRIFARTWQPVARADLESTITQALDGHLCRCTGYIRYHEAVRDVILADPKRYLSQR